MKPRDKFALLIFVLLMISGLLDIVLRFIFLGRLDWAILAVALDPAKSTMHVLLLPLAGYVLASRFPVGFVVQLLWEPRSTDKKVARIFSVSWAVLLLGIIAAFIANDPQDGFCSRLPVPSDVKSEPERKEMAQAYQDWLQGIKEGKAQTGTGSPEYEKYVAAADRARSGPDCNAWSMMTLRGYWAVGLTLQALIAVGVFLWLIGSYLAARTKPSLLVWEGFVLFVVLLAPWFALRPLSEWIINFGSYETSTYLPWYFAVLILLISALLVAVLTPQKDMAKILAGVVAGASVIFGALAAFWPGAFDPFAAAFTAQPLYLIAVEYAVTFFVIALVVWFFGSSTTPTADEEPRS